LHTEHAEPFRPTLEDEPPAFLDVVKTPWDHVPDPEAYNEHAYRRIVHALKQLNLSLIHI
jgi:hypothetical protein